MSMKKVAKKIREDITPAFVRASVTKAMKATSMNQGQLAQFLGVSSSLITAWKKGSHFPKPWVAHKLSNLDGCDLEPKDVLPHVFIDPSSEEATKLLSGRVASG